MAIPSDLESQSHTETIKSSFKSSSFEHSQGWDLLNLSVQLVSVLHFSYWGFFSHNIQSEFVLLLLPIAVIPLYVCTSLLWQEFLFLFSITPNKVQKIAKRSQAASQLQAKVASASLYTGTNHMYVCTYHILQSNTCLGGILLDSNFSLSREENRSTPGSAHGLQAEMVNGIASRVCACFMTRLLSTISHRLHC